ncbi:MULTISPECIES: glycosyltransferase family 9 protein [Rhizobium/Agrobacterium group]|uniref:glycosyltransferase family 9 protein n=1 Tax=Rhizobium/Agrobacterium group TaxID=227290 RepID=UPI001387406D|nr:MULTISPECIES: glycosyltransferase family 9 protein [Rhizobium/Agrobacterium group]
MRDLVVMPKKILLIKLDHIGDFVLGLSAFKKVRDTYPAAEITMLCGPWNVAIAKATGLFDVVHGFRFFPEQSGKWAERGDFDNFSFKRLGLKGFDVAIDLRDAPDTRFILDLVGASYRAGFAADGVSHHMDLALPSGAYSFGRGERVHHSTLQELLISAVIAKQTEMHNLYSILERVASKEVPAPLLRMGRGPIVGINCGSGDVAKNWPIRNFLSFAERLILEYDATIVVFGSPSQLSEGETIQKRLRSDRVINLVGNLSIGQYISTVRDLDLFVGNDTGTTHIAACLDVPTLCLFSGATFIESHGARGNNCIVVPAMIFGNASTISMMDVWTSVKKLLDHRFCVIKEDIKLNNEASINFIIIDNKPYKQDFRKYIARSALKDGANILHIQCSENFVLTLNENIIDEVQGYLLGPDVARRVVRLLGDKPTIVFVGLGTPMEVKRFVRPLKQLLSRNVVYYDVFDYFRYGSRGRDLIMRAKLDYLWRRVCDRKLLLDCGIKFLYPRKSRWLTNASHLDRLDKGEPADISQPIVYIGSIDERVDFHLLKRMALNGIKIDIFGRVHQENEKISQLLKELIESSSYISYHGEYDNDELPAILRNYHVGLLPYVSNTMTKHINPDKAYHYLNAGLEVIATQIPQTKRMQKFVHLIKDDLTKERLCLLIDGQQKAHLWSQKANGWEARWRELKQMFQHDLNKKYR